LRNWLEKAIKTFLISLLTFNCCVKISLLSLENMPQHGKCSKHFKEEEEDHRQEIRGLHCKNTGMSL
jgi:hypothetical protein